MNNSELREQLNIRYTEALYLGANKGNCYHFIYAYKRIFIELFKSILGCFRSLKSPVLGKELAIYATNNQKKALTNAKLAKLYDGELIHINTLSFKAAVFRLMTWFLKFVCYPLAFIFSDRKAGLYFTLFTSLMRKSCELTIEDIAKLGKVKIFLSNDHAGDIFIITILLRNKPNIQVAYVQHGAVKADFPNNYFDEVYVYDEYYADIYRGLSKSESVKICVNSLIERPGVQVVLDEIDFLICLSHQFPFLSIRKALSILLIRKERRVAIRFHPSDSLASFKYRLLKLYFKRLEVSPSNVAYTDDFKRAKSVLCASSSLLIDAYNKGFPNKIVWVKPFGLSWDYYNLSEKVKVINKVEELSV